MTRPILLVVLVAGALGLVIGWMGLGTGSGPSPSSGLRSLKPITLNPAPAAAPSEPGRHEFPLRAEDIANDRETPALAIDAEGHAVLAWAAQSGELERTLYLSRSADGGKTFDAPAAFRKVPIFRYAAQSKSGKSTAKENGEGKGAAMTYSTHVLPRLVATADGLYLGWVEAIDGGPKVIYYVARSTDGGKTFAEPIPIHGDSAKKPGFTTLTAASDGTLLAAWLDGRNQGPQPFCAAKAAGSEGFEADRLVFAGPETKGICPCCDVSAVRLPDGSDLVAFRNNDAGFRDIWFARAGKDGAFGPAAPLSLDRWTFQGCPHDGPSLALAGDTLHAAWMSAHSGKNRVYVASSRASDLAFAARELGPGTPGAQGHPKLAKGSSGTLHAVWDESLDAAGPAPAKRSHEGGHGPVLTGSGRAIMLATGDGQGFGPAVAVSPRPGAFQLNPAVAVGPDGALLIAWSEIDTTGKRIACVRRAPETGGR